MAASLPDREGEYEFDQALPGRVICPFECEVIFVDGSEAGDPASVGEPSLYGVNMV